MHETTPTVTIVAATEINEQGLKAYLESIGAPNWESDAETGVEEIVEVMSRSCYKSYGLGLNPNLSRVRDGNAAHIANIIQSGHGSVMEHAWVSFFFTDVSRVFCYDKDTEVLTKGGVASLAGSSRG